MEIGCIFDMDGVLLDSMKVWEIVAKTYLISKDREPVDDLAEKLRILTMEESAEYLIREYRLNQSAEQVITELEQMMRQEYEEQIPLKEGTLATLDWMKNRKIPMAVATSSAKELAVAAFQRLGILDYFADIVTDNDVGKGKRFPDIFLRAADTIHTAPEHIWVFEDSIHAMRTAKAAGFQVAAVYDASAESFQSEIHGVADLYLQSLPDFISWSEEKGGVTDEDSTDNCRK